VNVTITDAREAAPPLAPIIPSATIKLLPIKLEPFSGDIETWARFWEQFKQSIDNDPSLSTINEHIFLRGYLEEERKHLVEGIAVVAETYEETKKGTETLKHLRRKEWKHESTQEKRNGSKHARV
jgi:hypothetical protein